MPKISENISLSFGTLSLTHQIKRFVVQHRVHLRVAQHVQQNDLRVSSNAPHTRRAARTTRAIVIDPIDGFRILFS